MKKTDWIDVIGKIDPAYVKEAEQWSKAAQKKRNLKHFTAMAACVCILLAGAVVSFDLWVQNKDTGAETESAVAEGMNEGASAPNEGNETAVAKAEEEQTESVESESFADTDEQITINEVSELTTIAIDVGNGQEERMSAEELEQYYGVTVFPKNLPGICSVRAFWKSQYQATVCRQKPEYHKGFCGRKKSECVAAEPGDSRGRGGIGSLFW